MTNDTCSCWRCWFQGNFTAMILFFLTGLSVVATIGLMHEDIIADKYVIWMQGWCASVFSAFTLALQIKPPTQAHTDPLPPGATRTTETQGTITQTEVSPPAKIVEKGTDGPTQS